MMTLATICPLYAAGEYRPLITGPTVLDPGAGKALRACLTATHAVASMSMETIDTLNRVFVRLNAALMIDTYDRVFVRLNAALMIALLVCIVRCSRDTAGRRFIPGFLLIGAGVAILTVHQSHITPREWAFAVKSIALGMLIWGGVLVERLWKRRHSSDARPS